MKFVLPLVCGFALAAATSAFGQASPLGVWWMPQQSAKLKVAACDARADRLCGTIVWIKPRDPSRPVKTSDDKPRANPQSMIGQVILLDLKPDGPGKWTGGRFQVPGMTQKIAAKIALQPNGDLQMKGCTALVLCGDMVMKRAD